ncbi:MAG: YcgL domain-containing protein [Congregibacter sp.]
MDKRICEVFRSPRREGMYLYVDRSEGLARVPDAMLSGFGEPQSVMVLVIDENKRLARAKAPDVLTDIEQRGFYLQMPPAASELQAHASLLETAARAGLADADG